MTPPPKQVTILGVGLLGGSIALALRSAAPDCRIIGHGHRRESLERALEIGAIDQIELDPAASVRGSDFVILCTPVGLFQSLVAKIATSLAPGAIVTDVGSTKRGIVTLADTWLPSRVHFVGSHPIAGSEKRGAEFARADLLRHNLCILTPSPKTDATALNRVEQFWKMLEMRTECMSPEEHDRLLADISHLPHVLAAALVAMQEDRALEISGKGFLDTTRIAGGDGALWRDILLDNADNVRDALARLRSQLDGVESMLDAETKSVDQLKHWLDAAAKRRQDLLQRKLQELNPD